MKQFKFFLSSVLATLLFSPMALAQFTCVDVFAKQEMEITILPRDRSLLEEFQESRTELMRSTTNESANSAIQSVVWSTNYILDAVARNIITAKTPGAPERLSTVMLSSSNVLLSALEFSLNLPRALLEVAVIKRIDAIIESEMRIAQQSSERLPAGFGKRNREAIKEAEEISEQQPIGFVKPSDPIGPIEKRVPGFGNKPIVSEKEDSSVSEPIGFIKPSDPIGPVQKTPIGFVHFENKNGAKSPELNGISYNEVTGDFEVIKPNYKMGF